MSEITIKQLYDEIVKNRSEIKSAIEACELRVLQKVEEEKNRIDQLEKENSCLKEEIEVLKKSSRKNNIIIFGLKHQESGVTFDFLSKQIKDLLEINLSESEINNFYALGSREDSPIKIEFATYLKKKAILQNCFKLKGTHISISHDLSIKQRNERKLLRRYLSIAKKDKENTCYIKNAILYINDKTYTVEDLQQLEKKEDSDSVLHGVAVAATAVIGTSTSSKTKEVNTRRPGAEVVVARTRKRVK